MGFAWMAESADLGVVTGMDEYIERQALLDKLKERDLCLCVTEQDIKDAPAADVAPVRHGRWICKYDPTYGLTDITCSRCRDTRSIEGCYEGVNGESLWDQENYCPNCGAKMDLEEV